jgi:hypothetical protein
MALHTHNADDKVLGWYRQYFGALVGCKIIGFELRQDDPDPEFPEFTAEDWWPHYLVEAPDGTQFEVTLSADEEGNSSGWLFGLPMVEGVAS